MTRTEFRALYAECLASAIAARPEDYMPGSAEQVEVIADRMMAALDNGSAGITGSAGFRRLARRLGIPHTVRAITAAWEEATA